MPFSVSVLLELRHNAGERHVELNIATGTRTGLSQRRADIKIRRP